MSKFNNQKQRIERKYNLPTDYTEADIFKILDELEIETNEDFIKQEDLEELLVLRRMNMVVSVATKLVTSEENASINIDDLISVGYEKLKDRLDKWTFRCHVDKNEYLVRALKTAMIRAIRLIKGETIGSGKKHLIFSLDNPTAEGEESFGDKLANGDQKRWT